jgi:hypothetical protein
LKRHGQMQHLDLSQTNWSVVDEELMLQSTHFLRGSSANLSLHFWCKLRSVDFDEDQDVCICLHSDYSFLRDVFLTHCIGALPEKYSFGKRVLLHLLDQSPLSRWIDTCSLRNSGWTTSRFGDVWWSHSDAYLELDCSISTDHVIWHNVRYLA